MEGYFFTVNRSFASIGFINDTDEHRDMLDNNWSHYSVLQNVLSFMKSRGFEVGKDPRIEKEYKILSKDHWYGRKSDLEFKAERYPRGFKIKFYQNIIFENSHGGEYDFDKFEKMPYIVKLMWVNETNKIAAFLQSLGVKNKSAPEHKSSEDKIKQDFVDCWHHPQKDINFNLKDLDGTTCEEDYNNTDRNGRTILNGQVKYYRDYHGRLARGRVYHNINNMWWVIINSSEYDNIASFNLFNPTPEDYKIRRMARDRKPKEYIQKLSSLEALSETDMIKELKKRGYKVKIKSPVRAL